MIKFKFKKMKEIAGLTLMSLLFFMSTATAEASNGQALPDTGEEIAKTGAIIGGIILVIVVLIIFIRKNRK